MRDISFFVTTEHHMAEVNDFARSLGRPALQTRLRPDFLPALMNAAEDGGLLMLLSSTTGSDSFLSAIHMMGLSDKARERIQTVSADNPAEVRRLAAEADTIYVSTLVKDRVASLLPEGKKILRFDQHLSMESMDLIEAALLFGTRQVGSGL